MIGDFLRNYSRSRSSGTVHIMAAALRSFFRFLYRHEETVIDFSRSVPSIRRSCQAEVPAFLSSQEVERIISTPDLSMPRGRRDHAILLLLARLGLRAGEIVSMELDDICWRTGEILIRGKGRIMDRLPLLLEIGEALALYLRKDRGDSVSRKVFLRMIAPRIGLCGPAAIGHIVRLAFARAGIRPPGRGAAHIFRHSLATKMIRNGASLYEISQALRHRSQASTVLYAKVDFETLKGITSPWPVKGGVR
jgi:site-specific recombinase XerD